MPFVYLGNLNESNDVHRQNAILLFCCIYELLCEVCSVLWNHVFNAYFVVFVVLLNVILAQLKCSLSTFPRVIATYHSLISHWLTGFSHLYKHNNNKRRRLCRESSFGYIASNQEEEMKHAPLS